VRQLALKFPGQFVRIPPGIPAGHKSTDSRTKQKIELMSMLSVEWRELPQRRKEAVVKTDAGSVLAPRTKDFQIDAMYLIASRSSPKSPLTFQEPALFEQGTEDSFANGVETAALRHPKPHSFDPVQSPV
jgi:hypothetical protein